VTVPDQGEPVIHGRLLTGRRTRRLRARGDAEGAPLWWPHGKVAGEFLPRWLAEHGVAPPASAEAPEGPAVTVERSVRAMKAPEYQYLHELGREYRSGDPAIAALGRRMREMRSR
jgi:sulfide:quinone oxidoreductase